MCCHLKEDLWASFKMRHIQWATPPYSDGKHHFRWHHSSAPYKTFHDRHIVEDFKAPASSSDIHETLTYTLWFVRPRSVLTSDCCPPPVHCWFVSLITSVRQLRSMRRYFFFRDKIPIPQNGNTACLLCAWRWNAAIIIIKTIKHIFSKLECILVK